MLEQALAAELRQHVNRVQAGVNEITENEIDNTIFATEGDGRFGALLGKRIKAATFAAGENNSQYLESHGKVIVAISRLARNIAR